MKILLLLPRSTVNCSSSSDIRVYEHAASDILSGAANLCRIQTRIRLLFENGSIILLKYVISSAFNIV